MRRDINHMNTVQLSSAVKQTNTTTNEVRSKWINKLKRWEETQSKWTQLSSAQLSRKANEYKNEGDEKQMKTKIKKWEEDIKQMSTAHLSSAHLSSAQLARFSILSFVLFVSRIESFSPLQYYCSYWNIVRFLIVLFVLYYCSLLNIIGQIEKLFVSILLLILNYCLLFNIIVHIELLFVFNIIVHIALLLFSILLLSIILNIFQYYWNQ